MDEYYVLYENEITIATGIETTSIICYIPTIFKDRLEKKKSKTILSNNKQTIYRFYGIKKESCLIGYVKFSLSLFENQGEIDTIYIYPNERRKGLGRFLLEIAIEDIQKEMPNVHDIIVNSTPDAIPFYKETGFAPYFFENNLKRKLIK